MRPVVYILFISLFTALHTHLFAQTLTDQVIVSESGDSLWVQEGHIKLPEWHNIPTENTIELTYQVLRTPSNNPNPPIFLLAGGPGGSWLNTAHLNERFKEIQFYSQYSDVVIFDQRGAGRSIPKLICTDELEMPKRTPFTTARKTADIMALAKSCRDYWIAQGVDLAAYNTDESANDIDAIRAKLGYNEIILVGGSYGSHLGLHYLRKYEQNVHRAIFYGIEGPDHTIDKPAEVLNALRRISDCTRQAPYYAEALSNKSLLDIYEANHSQYDPLVAEVILTYKAGNRNDLTVWPKHIRAMEAGDLSFAKVIVQHLKTTKSPNAMGNMMDFASWASPERLAEIASDTNSHKMIGTLNLGYTARKGIWPAKDLGPAFRKNVISDKPVLLIHGDWDTSTPLENALEVHSHLQNSHLIVVEHGSHNALYDLFAEWDAIYAVLASFIQGQSTDIPKVVSLPLQFPEVFDKAQCIFWDAVIQGNIKSVQVAMSDSIEINLLDTRTKKTGRAALNWAAWNDDVKLARFLIENGADINQQNLSGYTAAHHAVENCSLKVLKFLKDHGADLSLNANNGMTLEDTANRNCPKSKQLIQSEMRKR